MAVTHISTDIQREKNSQLLTITLPDLFKSFLAQAPSLNPHYEAVGKESEQWLSNFCCLSPETQHKIEKCDFSYFIAIAAPYAPPDKFRVLCDWGNWVFPFDDMFDCGELRDQPEQSRNVIGSLLEPFSRKKVFRKGRMRIVEAHDHLALRMFSTCSTGIKRRYIQAMQMYGFGVLEHVDAHDASESPTLEQMIETRRNSVGAAPLYHLIEYAHQLKIPSRVFRNPTIKELEMLGMDFIFITNDIISYRKEESEGSPDNIIAACRSNGMSAQEAFDAAGELLESRYIRWEKAERSVPSWGAKIDKQVRRYIDGIKAVVKANLYWSFRSGRYKGMNSDEVRRTRKITVMRIPSYLQNKV